MKRSADQMLSDDANAHNNNTGGGKGQVLGLGDNSLSGRVSNLHMMICSGLPSPASKLMTTLPHNESVVSHPMASAKKVVFQQPIQGESELLKERSKLKIKVAAIRSRNHKEQEWKDVEAQTQALRDETSMLSKYLLSLAEECLEVKKINDSLLKEFELIYEPDVVSMLKAKDPFLRLSVADKDNNDNRESSREYSSSLADPSSFGGMVNAGSH